MTLNTSGVTAHIVCLRLCPDELYLLTLTGMSHVRLANIPMLPHSRSPISALFILYLRTHTPPAPHFVRVLSSSPHRSGHRCSHTGLLASGTVSLFHYGPPGTDRLNNASGWRVSARVVSRAAVPRYRPHYQRPSQHAHQQPTPSIHRHLNIH